MSGYADWIDQAPAAFPNMLVAADLFLGQRAHQTATVAAGDAHVTVEVTAPSGPVAAGSTVTVPVQLRIAEGWHVNGHEPRQSYLFATRVESEADGPVRLVSVRYPPALSANLAFSQEPLVIYAGAVAIEAQLGIAADAAPGAMRSRCGCATSHAAINNVSHRWSGKCAFRWLSATARRGARELVPGGHAVVGAPEGRQ